jgi:hypothetical protein
MTAEVRMPISRYRRDGHLVTVGPESKWSRVWRPGMAALPSTRRRNRCGISLEVPKARAWAWNVALIAVEAAAASWAHTVGGLSWTLIGAVLGGVVCFGVALMTYVVRVHTPRAIRRHHALLQAHLSAVEVVDRQSTPLHTVDAHASASATMVDARVSRTR